MPERGGGPVVEGCGNVPLTFEQRLALIPLVGGGCAVIDAEDWPRVAGHRWYRYAPRNRHTQYAVTKPCRKPAHLMHRLVLPGHKMIDHADCNGLLDVLRDVHRSGGVTFPTQTGGVK